MKFYTLTLTDSVFQHDDFNPAGLTDDAIGEVIDTVFNDPVQRVRLERLVTGGHFSIMGRRKLVAFDSAVYRDHETTLGTVFISDLAMSLITVNDTPVMFLNLENYPVI